MQRKYLLLSAIAFLVILLSAYLLYVPGCEEYDLNQNFRGMTDRKNYTVKFDGEKVVVNFVNQDILSVKKNDNKEFLHEDTMYLIKGDTLNIYGHLCQQVYTVQDINSESAKILLKSGCEGYAHKCVANIKNQE